jgi:gas vesicle protein
MTIPNLGFSQLYLSARYFDNDLQLDFNRKSKTKTMFKKYLQKVKRERRKKFFLTAVLASLAGALVAVFLTPFDGKTSRDKVKEKVARVGNMAKGRIDQTLKQAQLATSKSRDKLTMVAEKSLDKVDDLTDKIRTYLNKPTDEEK